MKVSLAPLLKSRHKLPVIVRLAKDLAVVRYAPKVLPAAVPFLNPIDAICEEPPPRFMWSTHYILIALFFILILAAALTRVDTVVVGGGALTTEQPLIPVQAIDRGIVREIRASAGDVVHKGQVLAVLDPTFALADLDTLKSQERAARARIARLEAELSGKPMVLGAQPTQDDLLEADLYRQRQDQVTSRLRVFDEEVKGIEADIRTAESERDSLTKQLVYAKELEAMRRELYQTQNGSKINFLDAQSTLVKTEGDYQSAVNRLAERQHSLESKRAERQNFIDDWRKQETEGLVSARGEAERVHEALAKASLMNDLVIVTAPADGVVLDVAKRSTGSIVSAAEQLFSIVPANQPLVADIEISSADIGYIKAGDQVVVKVQAFPYQRHGWLKGRLLYISEESYPTQGKAGEDGQAPAGAVHHGRVVLESTELHNLPTGAQVIPGMTVTAEIKAGNRSVLSYFLYPLTRGFEESLREP
jgi:HlyD family secretion protein